MRAELKPHLKEVARNEVQGEIARSNTLRVKAHAAKRRVVSELSKANDVLAEAEALSEKRLRRAQEAEEKLGAARDELCEMSVDMNEALAACGAAVDAKRKYEAMGKQMALVPTWAPTTTKGRGGKKQFDYQYRLAVYEQYANGTPRSAIGPNIVGIVRRTAPWLTPTPPSPRLLTDMRFEMRTVVECLAARDAAAAFRIRLLGSDESTKYGNPAITSNVIVEPTPGAELKVVVLRGVYC